MSGASRDKARQLKTLMKRPQGIPSVGVHDALSALVAQQAGFELLFLGGFGVSASRLGLPDLQFLGLRDMEQAVSELTAVLEQMLAFLKSVERAVETSRDFFEVAGFRGD